MKKKAKRVSPGAGGRPQHRAMEPDGLGDWQPRLRRRTPQELLDASMHDRIPALARIKNERMAASAFGYFRGAAPVMAYDLSLLPNSGIVNQLCGDAHVENLGAFEGLDGRLTFDINDFDETVCGPFEWDVKRMATSLLLAAQGTKRKPVASSEAVERFLDAYCDLMRRFARMPVLLVARFQVHRLLKSGPISKVFEKARHEVPTASLERLTEKTRKGQIFRSEPPLLRRVTGNEARAVLGSLPLYAESLLPERRHFLRQFRPLAVAFKVVGTGSVGLRDYCVLMQGNGPEDPLFLQIKQEVESCYAQYLPRRSVRAGHDGKRVADGQRAMQLQSDPLLGWTTIDGRSYLVRQLNDHKAAVDATRLKAAGLAEYATICGEMLARGHARSGDVCAISRYLGNGKSFSAAMQEFARLYAKQTNEDWQSFTASKTTRKPGRKKNRTDRKKK